MSLTGGAYPVVSADLLLKKRLGVGGELAWRASRNLYAGFQPYRPSFMISMGFMHPSWATRRRELMGGIGWESLRFYQGRSSAAIPCTDFVSSNHFMGHFGAGLRYYFHGNSSSAPKPTST